MGLNNREIAFLVWATVFIAYIFTKKKTREAFGGVIRAFFNPKIVGSVALMALWIGLCVYALACVGWWHVGNLKSTLIWSVSFAFVTLLNVSRISEDNPFFRKTVRDTISATVVITFIAELYSFSLFSELLLIPFLTFVTALQVVSEREQKHAAVHKLSSTVLIIAGLSYFSYGIYGATTDFDGFATWENAREFFVPIFLSLLFLPFIYALSVLVFYEMHMIRLKYSLKDDALRRYAMHQGMMRFRFDLEGLRRWTRNIAIVRPSNREEIRDSIAEVFLQKQRERKPPEVAPAIGWSPYVATGFLARNDLATSDYHRIDDGQWIASSKMVELDKNALFPDNLAYYVEGDESAAKRLKIKLNVNDQSGAAASESRFVAVCEVLLRAAVGEIPPALRDQIYRGDTIDATVQGRRVRMMKEDFANRAHNGYSRMLTIDRSPDYRDLYESNDATDS